MNKKSYLGLLAMVPLFTIALVTIPLEAEAVGGLGIGEAKERANSSEPEPDVKLTLKQIGEPKSIGDETRKSYKGYNEEQYDTTETFRAAFLIQNEGKDKVWNVEILVESDVDSENAKLVGKLDPKRSTISVTLKAQDPESINAKIVGYQA